MKAMFAGMSFCLWRGAIYSRQEDSTQEEARFQRIEEAQIAFESQRTN